MKEPRVIWGEDGLSSTTGWETVHTANHSGEYMLTREVWVVVGTGLNPGDYLTPPPVLESGKAAVMVNGEWLVVEDHRGQTVYNKLTQHQAVVDYLGPVHNDFTDITPPSPFHIWSGDNWVGDVDAIAKDELAKATTRLSGLMAEANNNISWLSDAVELGMATDDEANNLVLWKKYRVLLSRVDPAAPVWPEFPTE